MSAELADLIPDLPLLSVARCAEILSVSEDSVYRLVGRGELRAYDVAGTVRVYPPSLRDYLCRHVRHVPQPVPPRPEATSEAHTSDGGGGSTTRRAGRSGAAGRACTPKTLSRQSDGSPSNSQHEPTAGEVPPGAERLHRLLNRRSKTAR